MMKYNEAHTHATLLDLVTLHARQAPHCLLCFVRLSRGGSTSHNERCFIVFMARILKMHLVHNQLCAKKSKRRPISTRFRFLEAQTIGYSHVLSIMLLRMVSSFLICILFFEGGGLHRALAQDGETMGRKSTASSHKSRFSLCVVVSSMCVCRRSTQPTKIFCSIRCRILNVSSP